MAPLARIHATATEVSRPPEKAMPTRSPMGREVRTLDTGKIMHLTAWPCKWNPPSPPSRAGHLGRVVAAQLPAGHGGGGGDVERVDAAAHRDHHADVAG